MQPRSRTMALPTTLHFTKYAKILGQKVEYRPLPYIIEKKNRNFVRYFGSWARNTQRATIAKPKQTFIKRL